MNILSIILLAILLLFTGLFVLQKKLIHVMSLGLKVGFVICAFLLILVIFTPKVFDKAAEFTLKQSGTLEKMQKLDDDLYLNDINQTSQDIFSDLEDLFSSKEDGNDEKEDTSQGLIEKSLYPGFIELLSVIYKILTIFLSVIGMIIIIYLSYATLSVRETTSLEQRIKNLERDLAELQK